jgi:NADPH:quinone reductase
MPASRTALPGSKQVKASAVNPSDVGNVAGAFQAELLPMPGRDFAGVVVEGGGDEWNGKEVWGSGAGLGVKKDGSLCRSPYMMVASGRYGRTFART